MQIITENKEKLDKLHSICTKTKPLQATSL